MTAIAGCVGSPGANLETVCERILKAQSHYGRAKLGTGTLRQAAFGIALHGSLPEDEFDAQPLNSEGRFLLVADVRLDNREELVRGLGLPPRDRADAEILLEAWLRWRDDCFDGLVGDYAFAVWDDTENRLTLARDPTGQRPLFYRDAGDRTAFSSTPAGLLHGLGIRNGFDFGHIATMLVGVGEPGETAYFEGIVPVRPGQIVTHSPYGVSVRRHWHPPQSQLALSNGEYVEAYHEHLRSAVGARLRRQTGALAVHLSSGWDSGSVAATAASLAGRRRPIAFTSAPRTGFDGPVPRNRIADESSLAALVATQHGLEHIVVCSDGHALADLREHCRLYQDPFFDVTNAAWLKAIMREARERHVSTLLTGEMGNLTLHAGGLPVLAEWLRMGYWATWWREARAGARNPAASWRGILINSFDNRLPAGVVRGLNEMFVGAPKPSEQSFVREEWLRTALASAGNRARNRAAGGRYGSRFGQITASAGALFRKGQLAQFGIEERDPTSDRRLLEFSFMLPPEQLLQGGVWRPLARQALSGLLPKPVLNSPLRGYQGADWYERITPSAMREVLEEISCCTAATELLDFAKLRAAIDSWPNRGRADSRTLVIYRTRLPIALATGVFLQEFESLMSTSSAS